MQLVWGWEEGIDMDGHGHGHGHILPPDLDPGLVIGGPTTGARLCDLI
jgi:hypothetical protein